MSHNSILESSEAHKRTYNDDVARSLFSGLHDLQKAGTSCDVTLRIGERVLQAHKSVISVRSPYFMAMFSGRFSESKEKEVIMKEIDANSLELLIDFMYSGKLNIDSSNVGDILRTASFLQMTSAEEICQRFIGNELDVFDCIDYSTTENLLSGLNELRRDGTFCDVAVRVGERTIKVHKIVASISGTFKPVFPDSFWESGQREISIKDADADCVELLIKYMYTGMLSIDSTNVKSVLLTARLLKITSAEELCYKVMAYKLNSQTFVEYVLFANRESVQGLEELDADFHPLDLDNVKTAISSFQASNKAAVFLKQLELIRLEACVSSFVIYGRRKSCRRVESQCRLRDPQKRETFDCAAYRGISLLNIACKHSIKRLMDVLLEKTFAVFPKLFCGNDHLELNIVEMKMLTQRLSGSAHPEDLIYSFVMRWINSSASDTRIHFMKDLLDLLNPSLISPGVLQSSAFANTSNPVFAAWAAGRNAACLPSESDGRILYLTTAFGFTPSIIDLFAEDEEPRKIFLPRKLRYGRYVSSGYYIYHHGGWRKNSMLGLTESYVYNPIKREWGPFVPLQQGRHSHGSCVLLGRIYNIAGTDGKEKLSSVEFTDLHTGQNGLINPLPLPKILPAVGVHGNSVYVMGGGGPTTNCSCIHRFDPREGEWQELTPSPYGTGATSCAIIGDTIYTTHRDTLQRYEIRANDWARVSVEDHEHAAGVFAVNDILFGLFHRRIARFVFEEGLWATHRETKFAPPVLQAVTGLLLPNVARGGLSDDDFKPLYSLEISDYDDDTDSRDPWAD